MPILEKDDVVLDYLETGQGTTVILIHSTVSGNRQWKTLMEDLGRDFRVLAPNLRGYGKTSSWPGERTLNLSDQVQLIEPLIETSEQRVYLIGHSYGGSVALKAAMCFPEKTEGLLLLEPNPFYLLRQNHRMEGYREALELRDQIRKHGSKNNWTPAADFFANYWIGPGALENMSEKRKHIFIEGLKPNLYEWGMLEEQSTLEEIRNLSQRTMLIYDPKTVRSILEITELLKEACPDWNFEKVPGAGHNAPLTHPEWINPKIKNFLNHSSNGGE